MNKVRTLLGNSLIRLGRRLRPGRTSFSVEAVMVLSAPDGAVARISNELWRLEKEQA